MDYLRLEGLSAVVQELARQSEIAKVLSSVVDAVVDANGRALVDEMRVELEHALSEVREAEAEAGRLRDDRATFVAEASRLRVQLVNDYRQILQQLNERDELRSQLSFLQQRMLQLNGRQYNVQEQHAPPDDQQQHQRQQQQQHQHQKAPPAYLSIPGDADVSSTLPPPPRYTHPTGTSGNMTNHQTVPRRPTDLKLRGVLLEPTRSQRVSKRILSFMEADDIIALGDAALFYNRLVQWMFDENSDTMLPPDLVSEHSVWTAEIQATKILGDLPMPPSTAPPAYASSESNRLQRGRSSTAGVLNALPSRAVTETVRSSARNSGSFGGKLMSPFTRGSSNAGGINTDSKAKQANAAKAESMVRSLSRKELKEVARLGARCKQLEAKVMVLQNENADLSSMVDAAGTVKEFLLAKIKDLEDKTQLLQGQTDNDKEIIGFLDGSVQRQEQELREFASQRNTLQSENGIMRKELSELRTQKKVLVSEVKRLRKAIKHKV